MAGSVVLQQIGHQQQYPVFLFCIQMGQLSCCLLGLFPNFISILSYMLYFFLHYIRLTGHLVGGIRYKKCSQVLSFKHIHDGGGIGSIGNDHIHIVLPAQFCCSNFGGHAS